MPASHRLGPRALTGLLPDLAELASPRYRSIADAIAALLLDGRIPPGAALPSERSLANALGVSRSTTTAVYHQLATDGLLLRRRGSGSQLRLPPGTTVSGPGTRIRRGGAAVLDLSIAASPGVPAELPPAVAWAAEALAGYHDEIGYQPYGIRPLRELIAGRYTERGVATSAEQILVTNGAQHAFDLILRLMLHPGDRVLTELPTYPGALDAIRSHGGRVLAVPFATDGGWDLPALGGTFVQSSPRLAMLIPDFNNPTGRLIGTEQRAAALSAARRSGSTVVVDESFVDLDLRDPASSATPAPMSALDPGVFSIGSVSKPIWAGVRIGWIRADADTVSRLAVVRARSDMGGSLLDQLTVLRLLSNYQPILDRRRAELRERRAALLSALATELPAWQATRPDGGLSTWVRLDAPAATALTHLLEQRGILITPGSRFTVDASLERYLRIPFALPAELLVEAVGRLAQAWSDLDQHRVRRPESRALVPA
jgi:DNA-binding transcriptional MocR family regulator